jgi:hypothetical protein
MVGIFPYYETYRKKTKREIPVVVVMRVDEPDRALDAQH